MPRCIDMMYELSRIVRQTFAHVERLSAVMQDLIDHHGIPGQELDRLGWLPSSIRSRVPSNRTIWNALPFCLKGCGWAERMGPQVGRMEESIGVVPMHEVPFGLMRLRDSMLRHPAQQDMKVLEHETDVFIQKSSDEAYQHGDDLQIQSEPIAMAALQNNES